MSDSLSTDLQLTSLSLSDILNMTLLGDESFYRCEPVDRLLALGETYACDYRRLLDAGTKLRLENERLARELADMTSDYLRVHKAFCDLKYPETAHPDVPAAPREELGGWRCDHCQEWNRWGPNDGVCTRCSVTRGCSE